MGTTEDFVRNFVRGHVWEDQPATSSFLAAGVQGDAPRWNSYRSEVPGPSEPAGAGWAVACIFLLDSCTNVPGSS